MQFQDIQGTLLLFVLPNDSTNLILMMTSFFAKADTDLKFITGPIHICHPMWTEYLFERSVLSAIPNPSIEG